MYGEKPGVRMAWPGQVCRVLAFVVGIALLLPWPAVWRDMSNPERSLLPAGIDSVTAFVHARVQRAEAASFYGATEYARDLRELAALRDYLGQFSTGSGSKLGDYVQSNIDGLFHRALQAENDRAARAFGRTRAHVGSVGHGMVLRAVNEVRDLRVTPPTFLPGPVPREVTLTWFGFLHRWLIAWLWTLPLALIGIAWQFRSLRRSFLQEWVVRPWAPLLETVFWWHGLSGAYPSSGRSLVTERYERLVRDFRYGQQREPSRVELAALYAQAAGPWMSVEKALERFEAVPEIVQVRSRRAVACSWLVTTLMAPLQFGLTVATATAQTLRTNAVAAADTTRPRATSSLRGVFQGRLRREGCDAPLMLAEGTHECGRTKTHAKYDFAKGRVSELWAGTKPTASSEVAVGLVSSPLKFDTPPPYDVLMTGSSVSSLTPNFTDFGVAVSATRGTTTLQAAVLNGEGKSENPDKRVDLVGRIVQTVGPAQFTASVLREGGHATQPRQYVGAFARIRSGYLLVHSGVARRDDLDQSAAHLRLEGQNANWRGGFQVERQWLSQQTLNGLRLALERKLGGKNRLAVLGTLRQHAPPVWDFRFQRELVWNN